MRDVDRVDDFRVTNEVRLAGQHPGHEHVTVLLMRVEKELGRVPLKVEGSTPQPVPFVTWDGLRCRQSLPTLD
ncbi:MAG: hypothetical protein JRH14_16195 [Deltaproteobacteria bacterium]|nr:hypothetical protein [Deltaproteobacteria bacterium]